ncbi:MAG: ECF transporter S component [Clostridia bacterium]|nr:ECF transporter S component [Clostridia bacterium]
MKNRKTFNLINSAMFCTLVFAATFISIPAPLMGNINLGDSIILLGSLLLDAPWAIISGALGATLCDAVNGYMIYAPATFVIKGIMVCIMVVFGKIKEKFHINGFLFLLISAISAELFMALGYFVYEATVMSYGFGAAANIPFSLIQGLINTIIFSILYVIIKRNKSLSRFYKL